MNELIDNLCFQLDVARACIDEYRVVEPALGWLEFAHKTIAKLETELRQETQWAIDSQNLCFQIDSMATCITLYPRVPPTIALEWVPFIRSNIRRLEVQLKEK